MHLLIIFVVIIVVLFLLEQLRQTKATCSCGCVDTCKCGKTCNCSDCDRKKQCIESFKSPPIKHLRRSGRKIAHPILPAHKKFFPDNKKVLGLDFNEVFKNRLFECQTKCADFKDRKCYKMVNNGNVSFACLTEDMKNRYNKCNENGGSALAINQCMSSDGTKFYHPPVFY